MRTSTTGRASRAAPTSRTPPPRRSRTHRRGAPCRRARRGLCGQPQACQKRRITMPLVPITAAMLAPANPNDAKPRYSGPGVAGDWSGGAVGNDVNAATANVSLASSAATAVANAGADYAPVHPDRQGQPDGAEPRRPRRHRHGLRALRGKRGTHGHHRAPRSVSYAGGAPVSSGHRPNDQMSLPGLGVPVDPWTGHLIYPVVTERLKKLQEASARLPAAAPRTRRHQRRHAPRRPPHGAGLHQARRGRVVGGGCRSQPRGLTCRSMSCIWARSSRRVCARPNETR